MFWALQELVGPATTRSSPCRTTSRWRRCCWPPAPRSSAWRGDPEDGWALDLDALGARSLRPETWSCGQLPRTTRPARCRPRRGGVRRAVRRARHRAVLRRGLPRAGARPGSPLPQAADLSGRALSLNVMSKAYGLPGLRIGWLACRDRALLERLERLKVYTSHLQRGAGRSSWRTIALHHGVANLRPQPRHHPRQPPGVRRLLRPLAGATSPWSTRTPAPSASPRLLGEPRTWRPSAAPGRDRQRAAAPRRNLRLRVAESPAGPLPHRRRPPDPAPALEALDAFLGSR